MSAANSASPPPAVIRKVHRKGTAPDPLRGRVLNVASIAAFQPVPMLATYAATKAYLLSLTESLAVAPGSAKGAPSSLVIGFAPRMATAGGSVSWTAMTALLVAAP